MFGQELTESTDIINVLYIDDNENILECVEIIFKNVWDVSLTTATDQEEVLELLKSNHFDVLLVDLVMHGMSGFELINEVKKFNTDIKIGIVTGGNNTFSTDCLECDLGGNCEFLHKPYDLKEIYDFVVSLHNKINVPVQVILKNN